MILVSENIFWIEFGDTNMSDPLKYTYAHVIGMKVTRITKKNRFVISIHRKIYSNTPIWKNAF